MLAIYCVHAQLKVASIHSDALVDRDIKRKHTVLCVHSQKKWKRLPNASGHTRRGESSGVIVTGVSLE